MANIFYIDDALGNENQNLEIKTLNFLQGEMSGHNVRGFKTDKEIFRYFFNYNNPIPDLLILDHNLWWHKDDSFPYGYEFRYSDQLIHYLKGIRKEVLDLPKIIFSDDNTATVRYRNSDIPYISFVPKWGDSPWTNLVREVKLFFEPTIQIERHR